MPLSSSTPDRALLAELGQRLARLRLDRNLSQDDLAREAGVSKRTLHRMEHGHSAQMTNWIRVLRALDQLANLEQFLPAPAPSPMQQLKLQGKLRRRASSSSSSSSVAPAQQHGDGPNPWTWGDDR
jgi:transcriptional regulator with XRE-family HTH domain